MDVAELDALVARVGALVSDLQGTSGREAGRNVKPFIYTGIVMFSTLTLGVTGNCVVQISAEADFVCTHLRCSARLSATGQMVTMADDPAGGANEAGGGDADAPYLIQVASGSGDRLWHNAAVDAWVHYGPNSANGGMLPRPYRFAANSSLQCDLTTVKAAPAANVFVARVDFKGYKVMVPGRS